VKDSTVTFRASPGSAPSTNTGPVTGLTKPKSSLATSATVEVLVSWSPEASAVAKLTLSPGAMVSRGEKALFQPWWLWCL